MNYFGVQIAGERVDIGGEKVNGALATYGRYVNLFGMLRYE